MSIAENVLKMAMTLYDDEVKCLSINNQAEETEQEGRYFCHRTFIRAACAVIEGCTYSMKNAALIASKESGVCFTRAEKALLREETYRLKNNGDVEVGSANPRFLENIKFAFRMYARAHRIPFDLRNDDVGWKDLRHAKSIRNKLMHPKLVDHLLVSEGDAMIMARASIWFGRNMVELFSQCNPSIEDRIKEFKDQLNNLERLYEARV